MKSHFSPNFVRIFVVVLSILVWSGAALATQSFTVKPAPSWVRNFGLSTTPSTATPGTSSSTLIDDQQIRVSKNSVERYSHYLDRVDNTAGLDDLSQLRFYFEPSYQQLTIHYIRIQRNGSTIEALKASEVKMVQQEEELDQQLYNGTMAAVVFVNDLRVGDVVDYAYTVTGENPVLGGRFADTLYLAGTEPIQEQYVRLLYPSDRTFALKRENTNVEPTKQSVGDDTELLWYQRFVPPVGIEGSTPDWFNPYPLVSVSEFQSWNEVVNWALPYYQLASIKNPELLAKIEEWKKSSDKPAQRAIAALRFVQDEIRYLGIELGRYSHQPTTPEKVFARRFGDCKDKSLLLSSILAAMGIEASPALVNSETRWTIDSQQPSPFAFDHVIVNAKIDGKTYWFDPTMSYQRGGLDQYYDPPYQRGLVLRANGGELEKIPTPSARAGSLEVLETYQRLPGAPAITLTVKSVHRGLEADSMRYRLSTSELAELSKSHVNYYADSTPSIKADGLPVVNDDQETNTIIMVEKYLIDDFWKDGKHRFLADRITPHLYKPRVSQRSTPLEVPYPVSIVQKIIVDLGSGFDFPTAEDSFLNEALKFDYKFWRENNKLIMEFALQTFGADVPVDKAQQHIALIDKIQRSAGYDLAFDSSSVIESSRGGGPLRWIGWLIFLPIIVLFLIWLVRRLLAKKRVSSFVEKQKAAPGSTAETALQFATPGQLESALVNFTCRCGSRPYDPASPPKRERFLYDGQRLMGIRFQCAACSQSTDLYVNVLEEPQSGTGLADLKVTL